MVGTNLVTIPPNVGPNQNCIHSIQSQVRVLKETLKLKIPQVLRNPKTGYTKWWVFYEN